MRYPSSLYSTPFLFHEEWAPTTATTQWERNQQSRFWIKGSRFWGEIWGWGYTFKSKFQSLFSEEQKKNRKNGRKWIEWTNGEELIWFFCSQRKQKPEQDSGHNQTVPKQRERKEVLYHILFFSTHITFAKCFLML